MTEAEWLACTRPEAMLKVLRGKASDRKLRLFACACARRIWEQTDKYEFDRSTIHAVELLAEGPADVKKLADVREVASLDYELLACEDVEGAARWATGELSMALPDWLAERIPQARLLRDLFGNPFHPADIDPSWLIWNDATILKFAQGIHADRAFDRLPILADALEDAGCDNADILAHCRGPGPHVRGCWVVDLLLGKS